MANNAVVLSPYRQAAPNPPTPVTVEFAETSSIPTPAATPNVNLGFRNAAASNLGYTQLTYVSASDGAQRRLPDCEYLVRSNGILTGSTGGPAGAFTADYTYLRNGRQATIIWDVAVSTVSPASGSVLIEFPDAANPAASTIGNPCTVRQAISGMIAGIGLPVITTAAGVTKLDFHPINATTGVYRSGQMDWSEVSAVCEFYGQITYLTDV